MGRRRKQNKKGGDSNTSTPPPEEADIEADEGGASTLKNTEPAKVADTPPAAVPEDPVGTTNAAVDAATEVIAEPVEVTATTAPAEEAAPVTAKDAPQPPTTVAAAAEALNGVAALNAYALQNATVGAAPTPVALPPGGPAKEEDHPLTEVPIAASANPPRAATKKVAFITPVISSVTSVSDAEAPRESNCIESRCGSCNVM
ncbi:hypothetical protein ABB37_01998 [Leptomonas pyrrhocoris]|uniref:Uncharacterized protein n=1 Tax=Leptomonas pyrrhocoris TaxID=157538 RepID=A0A0M9G782_LEPPY|nr:hypothetical protein ABB37_01998 [Leptomonas pyrrhocoris]XP_015662208.1 hypothetical protein ABB37_01998 [Leptomonas pyrrhocoris]KPA83768.1 hypothetical protein ABB37_01998 [Leptomonas pyrrhocoris]KPA83769.1 hypothetical protein ABB37_01998 [Leptomonas pyrrhocoris]|eukprot:XP_015662207.1 hypothetical protein ABB37_01998 [Leptomonas pyrrhocoris]